MNYKCFWNQNGHYHAAILTKEDAMDIYKNLQPALNLGIAVWVNLPTEEMIDSKSEDELLAEWEEYIKLYENPELLK